MHKTKAWTAEKSIAVMWSRINKSGPNGCWIYSGQVNSKGYGAFTYAGKPMVAVHRFIYQQIHGPLPRTVYCLHKCDNPLCCNPDHIFLGDDAANHADMVRKGRNSKGEQSKSNKLTAAQVQEIRLAYRIHGRGNRRRSNSKELADKYGVGQGAITSIISGRYWKHLSFPLYVSRSNK